MLEVVEQQQRLPVAQVLEQRLTRRLSRPFLDPELAGDRPRDESRVGDAAELDEHGACGLALENARHLEREARLPRSGCTRQRQEPHVLAAKKLADLTQLARPPDEGRRATLQARLRLRCAVGRRLGGDEIERRILVENRALELPERERRLDAERLHERAPRIAIRRERVRLPSRAVEGEHELGAEALPERVLADQQLELGDELGARAQREIGLDALLERLEPKLLEPSISAAPRARRRTRPEAVPRQSESASRNIPFASAGAGDPRIRDELLEAVAGRTIRHRHEARTRRDGPDHAAAERPAELGDVRLEDLRRRGRRPAGPELLDQAVARDRLVRAEEQDREQGTRLCRVQRDDAALGDHLERPEDTELHGRPPPDATPSRGLDSRATPALDRRSTGDPEGAEESFEQSEATDSNVRRQSPIPEPARRRPQGVSSPFRRSVGEPPPTAARRSRTPRTEARSAAVRGTPRRGAPESAPDATAAVTVALPAASDPTTRLRDGAQQT